MPMPPERLPHDRLEAPLLRCAAGDLAPNVALAQLLMQARDHGEAEAAFAGVLERLPREQAGRVHDAHDLWRDTPDAFDTIRGIISIVEDSPEGADSPEHWSAVFDRTANVSAVAGVALYTLGRDDLLLSATREIADRLREWRMLDRASAVLDLGCGSGRIVCAIADQVDFVVGADVSPAMLAAARERCRPRRNVSLVCTAGRDLAMFGPRAFDAVVAVDVFPYLVPAGLAASHIGEAARVLKPGGRLAILNFSYRGAFELDRADVARMAQDHGFDLVRAAIGDFSLWDGTTFLLQSTGRS